ncbi:MAG: Glutamine synthetase type I [Ktedonobacterales bacterium]|jgi:glutamine synthetase|nr:MAG: Glutamine synthetase type I [Ktedonobacterales bacterium]
MTSSPDDVVRMAREKGVRMVDLKFADVPGMWHHMSIPVRNLTPDIFEEGIGFDGSSIRGFQDINESDMLLMPDPASAILDPFTAEPTLSLVCNVAQPGARHTPYTRDPRYIAQKAEAFLIKSGIADRAYFGPEAEFFIFDDVKYRASQNEQWAVVESDEAHWNSGRNGTTNLGHRMRPKEGYSPVAPNDTLHDLRTAMVLTMEDCGIDVEAQHHEVAAGGQCEIDMRFDSLLTMADRVMLYKYIVKNIARRAGKTVTFMPKPIFGDNGSGMHVHMSLWKGDEPLFADPEGYAGISEMARFFIGGLLTHAPAVLALAAPTTNSYRRLVPGYEAPVNLVYSQRNRSAAVRIPMYSDSPKAKRVEFRPPDPTCNPYLTFSALLMAGLDGIRREITPEKHGFGPLDRNIYEMCAEEKREIKSVPGSLGEALTALELDHEFLLEGDVFTTDLLAKYIELRREQDAEVRLRPAPLEFALYYDA